VEPAGICPRRIDWLLASVCFASVWLASCRGFGGQSPSGSKTYVELLDGDRLRVGGEELDWGTYIARLRAQVQAAEAGHGAMPWLVIEMSEHRAKKLGDREAARVGSDFLDLLRDTGVRSIDLGR